MTTEIAPRGRVRRTGAHRRDPVAAHLPSTPAQSRFLPILALVVVAVIWGVTFSVVDVSVIDTALVDGPAQGDTAIGDTRTWMPPADLVAWRFGLGAVVLVVIRLAMIRHRTMPRTLLSRGVALGVLLGLGFLLQAWAMTYTDAMMSGFLTGMLVVFAPVAGWLAFRDRLPATGWIAVGIATAGLALLSLRGNGFGPGELLTLLAAAVWALHLVLLSRWAEPEHAIGLAAVQSATVAGMALVAAAVGAAVAGRAPLPTLPVGGAGWLGVLFLAVLATAAAMVLLSWAQSRMSATRAAIILTLEPAVAGVTAACLGTELGPKTLVGGALLVTAMVVVELRTGRAAGCVT
jgi:drug/metabolite transporter (DMT)-like permease